MDDKAQALEAVRHYVWSGLYDPEEVAILIEDEMGEPGKLDPSWLRAEVGKEMARKRAEEATWPATTDCDRLDRVLEALEEQGIIALQDAGYTKSEGISEVTEVYDESGGEDQAGP